MKMEKNKFYDEKQQQQPKNKAKKVYKSIKYH